MNKIFLAAFTVFILTISCEKDNKSACRYDKLHFSVAVDTTVYLYYELNNEPFKFYQCAPNGYSAHYYADIDENRIWYKAVPINFNTLQNVNTEGIFLPGNTIWFYFPFYYNNKTEPPSLLDFLKKNKSMTYVYPPKTKNLSDTTLLKGVGISYYTEALVKKSNYDQIRINELLEGKSFFTIDEISPICDNHYLIEGRFETKTILGNDTLTIKNGQFRFAIPTGF
jgi:hypothetical protein